MFDGNEKNTKIFRKVTWPEFDDACMIISEKLKDFSPDWIIGISRGGLPLAVALSHQLGCRNVGVTIATKGKEKITYKHTDSYYSLIGTATPANKPKRILVVDDFVGIGDVFTLVKSDFRESIQGEVDFRYATVFAIPENIKTNGYQNILESLCFAYTWENDNVVFPWEVNGNK